MTNAILLFILSFAMGLLAQLLPMFTPLQLWAGTVMFATLAGSVTCCAYALGDY